MAQCKKMPVKKHKLNREDIRELLVMGAKEREKYIPEHVLSEIERLRNMKICHVKDCAIEGSHVHVEDQFFKTYEKHYSKMLMKLKPANYKD